MDSDSVSKDDNMQLNAMAAAANFKEVPLTPDVIQEALDAVRYKKNYNRAVTSRFCLHYIDKISTRVINKLVNYLISVDGCESSTVVDSGICDINYCKPKPYTYELKLEQKAAGSYDFGVTSIYKNVDQPRSSDEIRNEPSNLDIPELPSGEAPVVIENPPAAEIPYLIPDVFWPEGSFLGQEIPVIEQPNPATTPENPVIVPETESESPAFVPASPVQWQSPAFVPETPATEPESPVTVPDTEADELEEWSGGSEEPVDWAANDLWWESQPESTEEAPVPQSISLRVDAVDQRTAIASGFPAVAAIVGVATVSISTVVLVLALVVVRSRSRANAAKRTMNQEKAPLCSSNNNTDVAISMANGDNIATDSNSTLVERW
ncbi:hypothetical protein PR003_g5121 [Phytophthora rubi]|uniref:Uncharacterized protein n=1 Tax=Phytophthora rubi TaxID=129364 RepID=A0A6A3NG48_9STRA|nr:hypothetical protein PR002_g5583 [Phytophthora rubi]KAE9045464.1 hypothetical protein PR001_g4977 [Phytophthora rubi]KAE9350960.1 hypothetical protein PR003_g5121 [Phytophthora rubi]